MNLFFLYELLIGLFLSLFALPWTDITRTLLAHLICTHIESSSSEAHILTLSLLIHLYLIELLQIVKTMPDLHSFYETKIT